MENSKSSNGGSPTAKPFAIIMRRYDYAGEGVNKFQGTITGEYPLVRGLKDHDQLDAEVDVRKTKNANVKAREIADKGHAGDIE